MRRLCISVLAVVAIVVAIVAVIVGGSISSPASAKTLRAGASAAPSGYGNPYSGLISLNVLTTATLFDSLTSIGPDGSVQPALAVKWEVVSDNTWRFELRPGVTFSNGEPLNATAVVETLRYLTGPDAAKYVLAREASGIASVYEIDALTVGVTTKYPDAILPKRLSMLTILPPRAWAELGPDGFAETPIGTGSYVLEDWGKGEGKAILRANRASWRAPVEIDHIEMRYPLRDPGTRLAALRSGDVDITLNISFDDIPDVRAEGYSVLVQQVPQIRALALPNIKEESPLNDVRVRQALNYAVDKQTIADVFYQGVVSPVGQGAIPGTVGYNPDIKPYPYDPARARLLLAEAGYAEGLSLNAEVEIGQAQVIYQKAAQDLAKVGVTLNVRTVVAAEWIRKYFSGDLGRADILSLVWDSGAYRDTIRSIETYSCAKPNPLFCEPSLMPAIRATGAMFDVQERDQALQAIMADMHELAPALFLINHAKTAVAVPKVQNIILTERGLAFEKMRIEDARP